MVNSIVEGLNRVLEHEREIRGISASGFQNILEFPRYFFWKITKD